MKRTIESKIYDNENYTIYTEEYVESGIFFQNPIQERTFDTDPFEDNHFDFYDFQAKWNDSFVFRFIHTLLGNKKQMDAIRREDTRKSSRMSSRIPCIRTDSSYEQKGCNYEGPGRGSTHVPFGQRVAAMVKSPDCPALVY